MKANEEYVVPGTKMTQCDRIRRHLEDFGSISSWEAMTEYGIMRLASRIVDLRRRGLKINVERKTKVNRYGEKIHYAEYSLAK